MISSLTLLVAFATFPAYAQVFHHRRRSNLGRIIAGCIIGGLAVILFMVAFCLLARRRRARATTFHPGFSGQPPNPYPTGWSSGPYQGHQSVPPPPPPHGQYGAPPFIRHDYYGGPEQQGPDDPKYPMYPPPYGEASYRAPNQFNHSPPAVPPSAHTKLENP